jgi:hypothetical protein
VLQREVLYGDVRSWVFSDVFVSIMYVDPFALFTIPNGVTISTRLWIWTLANG